LPITATPIGISFARGGERLVEIERAFLRQCHRVSQDSGAAGFDGSVTDIDGGRRRCACDGEDLRQPTDLGPCSRMRTERAPGFAGTSLSSTQPWICSVRQFVRSADLDITPAFIAFPCQRTGLASYGHIAACRMSAKALKICRR
jgi:hypothetical protein